MATRIGVPCEPTATRTVGLLRAGEGTEYDPSMFTREPVDGERISMVEGSSGLLAGSLTAPVMVPATGGVPPVPGAGSSSEQEGSNSAKVRSAIRPLIDFISHPTNIFTLW